MSGFLLGERRADPSGRTRSGAQGDAFVLKVRWLSRVALSFYVFLFFAMIFVSFFFLLFFVRGVFFRRILSNVATKLGQGREEGVKAPECLLSQYLIPVARPCE